MGEQELHANSRLGTLMGSWRGRALGDEGGGLPMRRSTVLKDFWGRQGLNSPPHQTSKRDVALTVLGHSFNLRANHPRPPLGRW